MEEKFIAAWAKARQQAEEKGVKTRPVSDDQAMQTAHRSLSGHRESDGFWKLAEKGLLKLSLEVLATRKEFTALFSDEEVNNALNRLLDAGYTFQ